MTANWSDADRDTAYSCLCEPITQAGQDNEVAFLARLTLLLAEELGDLPAFPNALDQAGCVEIKTDDSTKLPLAGWRGGSRLDRNHKDGRNPCKPSNHWSAGGHRIP